MYFVKEDNLIIKEKELMVFNEINKVNSNLERFNYNVIIANMYEAYNFLFKRISA